MQIIEIIHCLLCGQTDSQGLNYAYTHINTPLLWLPVEVTMLHSSCCGHDVVHSSQEFVVVPLYRLLSIPLDLLEQENPTIMCLASHHMVHNR